MLLLLPFLRGVNQKQREPLTKRLDHTVLVLDTGTQTFQIKPSRGGMIFPPMYFSSCSADPVVISMYIWHIYWTRPCQPWRHVVQCSYNQLHISSQCSCSQLCAPWRYMAVLHNSSLPSWSVFCCMHARVSVCYEVDILPLKSQGSSSAK